MYVICKVNEGYGGKGDLVGQVGQRRMLRANTAGQLI